MVALAQYEHDLTQYRPYLLLLPAWTATRQERTCTACGGMHLWTSEVFGFEQTHVCPHCDAHGMMIEPMEPGELTHLELAAIEDELWAEHWALWLDYQAPYI